MNEDLAMLRQKLALQDLPDVASEEEVAGFERRCGLRLPPFLRAVYLMIGNGGFGPGYGLLPLAQRGASDEDESCWRLYLDFLEPDADDPAWLWPKDLVPINDWGCAIRSCVDCSSEEGRVVRFDPNGHGPRVSWKSAFRPECVSVRAWLLDWASGKSSVVDGE
jgi:hypothetical protein